MYSINGAHAAGGNPIYAQQGRARQAWINKFNSQARTAERKADERLGVEYVVNAVSSAVFSGGNPIAIIAGALVAPFDDMIANKVDHVLGIAEH